MQYALFATAEYTPIFEAASFNAAWDALVEKHIVHVEEVVVYETSKALPVPGVQYAEPLIVETFAQAWARESAAVISGYRGNRKSKGGK